ncbi:hypothetical protein Ndes2526B_g01449 [Nannochloris sp. 'desiccata']|nr:hypothetical protein KSW81_004230 [Chlorella desiccata (nom. nud.)]KAH7624190.1 putative DNA helicase MCM8 [Chlorella desiccata (nom. nud.)]
MTTQQQTAYVSGEISNRKPSGWDYYWPANEYTEDDRRALLIRELAGFFCSPAGRPLLASARTRFSQVILSLDWTRLTTTSGITDLAEAMFHAPTEALACLGAAAHTALFLPPSAPGHRPLPASVESPAKVCIHLTNHQGSFVPISAIRADQVGRLVTLRGTVSRTTPVRPLVTSMEFVCAKCGSSREVDFPDGRFQLPTSCGVDGCRSRTLAPNRAAAKCVDWQRVQLQGLPRDEGRSGEGRVPRPIDVELLEDLVEKAPPGEVITITGVVKVLQGEHASGKRFGGDAKRQCLFLPYVEAVSVVRGAAAGGPSGAGAGDPSAAQNEPVIVAEPEGISYLPPNMPGFTQLDLDFIRAFTASCEGGDQLRQLVHSLAPGICGMEAEKAGLLLALFGGVRKFADSDNSSGKKDSSININKGAAGKEKSVPVRGDIHVLLVGDPGLGKSQLLQAAAAAAPRGVYVCGSATSSAGLTVSVVKEGGDYCFDAGALVLADRGVCCVDEFDKATGEHAAMLGAMEQQEVAVAKAGLVASLPARTTVLAAANPVEGHYNRGKTLMQNMKMSPAMLSRFDLVFLLLDRPDAERDQRLTEHVMAAHSGIAARAHAARAGLLLLNNNNGYGSTTTGAPLLITNGGPECKQRPPLRERLKLRKPDDEPLPPQLLRKYIAYARQYVHPILTSEAAAVIKSFYLNLRQQSAADPGAPPVTHRQLESLVRLAEARARIDLREHVTAEDAKEAVEIMKESLAGMICDGPEMINFNCGGSYSGLHGNASSGKRGFQAERHRFLDVLQRHCEAKNDKEIEVHELYSIADKIELAISDTAGFIEQLNEAGDLLKRGGGRYIYNAGSVRLRKEIPTQAQEQHTQQKQHQERQYTNKNYNGATPASAPGAYYEQQGQEQRGAVNGKRGALSPEPLDDGFDW